MARWIRTCDKLKHCNINIEDLSSDVRKPSLQVDLKFYFSETVAPMMPTLFGKLKIGQLNLANYFRLGKSDWNSRVLKLNWPISFYLF